MKEKIDEMYQEYLSTRLDLIFDFSGDGSKSKPKPVKREGKTIEELQEELGHKIFTRESEDGFIRVNDGDKFTIADSNGYLITGDWYDGIYSYHEGFAMVEKDKKYNFIDQNGKLISKTWFEEAYNFSDGCAKVKKDGKYNFINKSGKLISRIWFDEAEYFYNGFAKVVLNHYQNSLDQNGNLVFKQKLEYVGTAWDSDISVKRDTWAIGFICYPVYRTKNFITVCDKEGRIIHTVYKDIDLKDYVVNRGPFGYKLKNGHNSFRLKYEPLKVFNSTFVLCHDDYNVYLYNKTNNTYELIGDTRYIEYDDNFIIHQHANNVRFIYGDNVYDITDYYWKKNLSWNRVKNIKMDISILSKNDFFCRDEDEIRAELAKEKAEDQKRIEKEKKEQDAQKIKELKEKEVKDQKELTDELKKEKIRLAKSLMKLRELEGKTKKIVRIDVDELFIKVKDHKEIDPLYIEQDMLRNIDLSKHSFDNVKISGIDFEGTNVEFNPQKVYQKDLRNCNFMGVFFHVSIDFSNVDIRGAKFTSDEKTGTFDINKEALSKGIYDETTTLNGESLVELLHKNKSKKRR